MTRKIFILVFTCIISITLSCASGHRDPFPESQEIVRDITPIEKRLVRAVNSSNQLSMKVIGEIDYGDFKAPVWLVSFVPSKEVKYRVFVNGCIHGDEPAGAEVILEIIEILARSPHRYEQFSFDIVPIVNPWGYSCDIRFNRDGRDVNRDFSSFMCQESRTVKKYVDGKRYHLMIDLHEDPDGKGFYMYQYGNPDTSLSRKTIEIIRKMDYPIEQDVNMIMLKTEDGLIDAPMWGLWYMRITKQLSISNYYRFNNSDNVYTIETPTILDLKDRVKMQMAAFKVLLNSLQ